ncbi:MAG: hypothetical protein IPK25_15265 [Saprospiraceae bacterium]|nr:hypothetical protein [Saprospiraceae bacterium]
MELYSLVFSPEKPGGPDYDSDPSEDFQMYIFWLMKIKPGISSGLWVGLGSVWDWF